jgi:hypothetical protein
LPQHKAGKDLVAVEAAVVCSDLHGTCPDLLHSRLIVTHEGSPVLTEEIEDDIKLKTNTCITYQHALGGNPNKDEKNNSTRGFCRLKY